MPANETVFRSNLALAGCGYDEIVKWASLLQAHNFVHTGQKPHACPDCGKKFSLSSNMRRHLLTHSGEKPWECNDCHKCFTEKRSLEVHKRLTYRGTTICVSSEDIHISSWQSSCYAF